MIHKGVFDYEDDCDVCQAMKKAEEEGRDLTKAEWDAALHRMQESGKGIVGFMDGYEDLDWDDGDWTIVSGRWD